MVHTLEEIKLLYPCIRANIEKFEGEMVEVFKRVESEEWKAEMKKHFGR